MQTFGAYRDDQSGRQFDLMADLTHPHFQHASQMVHQLPQWEEGYCLVSSSAMHGQLKSELALVHAALQAKCSRHTVKPCCHGINCMRSQLTGAPSSPYKH